jgi:hypothetical protein
MGYNQKDPGFFLFPADPQSNNLRAFVVSAAVKTFKYLGSGKLIRRAIVFSNAHFDEMSTFSTFASCLCLFLSRYLHLHFCRRKDRGRFSRHGTHWIPVLCPDFGQVALTHSPYQICIG